MSGIKDFLILCSGSDRNVLKRTPTEINKVVGIGGTIFFTGIFSALAASYAIFTVFDSYLAAVIFGVFWGLMIFNLDRYIVSSMKRKGNWWKDFGAALPRLILAVIIAIVIAKPLELRIFDDEIRSELVTMQQEQYKVQEEGVDARFQNEINVLNGEISILKEEISDKTIYRDNLVAEAIAEADGTGGSQRRNMGPIYRAKKTAADEAEQELAAVLEANTSAISEKNNRLAAISEEKLNAKSGLEKVALTGFAGRLEALNRVSGRSDAIFVASIFIMLLFIAIETAPIFVKLISSRSPYDYVLNKHEHVYVMNHDLRTQSLSYTTGNKLEFEKKTGAHKTQLAINAENELAGDAIAKRIEEVKKEPYSWKELLQRGRFFEVG